MSRAALHLATASIVQLTIAGLARATDVSGPQTGTWTLAGSPYHLVGDVTVPAGWELYIQPGVQVIAKGYYRITVEPDGLLVALGKADQPILFTAENTTTGWRGLRLLEANPNTKVKYCIFEYAKGTGPYPDVRGGALYVYKCSPEIYFNTFRYNYSKNANSNGIGAGILTEESNADIFFNTIIQNSADSGAGIGVTEYGSPLIVGNVIQKNTASYAGGGIYCGARSSPIIEGNLIVENTSAGWGGGGINSWTSWVFYGTSATIRNNIIARNKATTDGGGVYCRYDKAVLYNNTIVANTAARGGGIYVLNQTGGPPDVANCVLWGNAAPTGPQLWLDSCCGSAVVVSYSDVQGGWPGTGNVAADPLFVDYSGGDYHLAAGSPCIDSGNNLALDPSVMTDFDGKPRFLDDPATPDTGVPGGSGGVAIVDMGAYEFPGAPACIGDVDGDGKTCQSDLGALLATYGLCEGDPGYNPAANLSQSQPVNCPVGKQGIDQSDLGVLLADYGCGGCA